MPNRIRAALIASLTLIGSQLVTAPVGAVVGTQKVVIIVGPTGAQTDDYRQKGDAIATAATADGATVVKVYSPVATWANVKEAVNGANIVIYLGHGNGFPDPYGTTKLGDRVDGWGLNRTTTGGDSDNWSTAMVYCGEKALLGTLSSSDGAEQRTYCAGGPITPAPNWAMIYSNACYAPGASEGWDVPATQAVALQRVRNYSYPGLQLAGGAYFATDMYQGSLQLVDTILRNPNMPFGAIAEHANGYDLTRQRHYDHPDLTGTRIWLQNSGDPSSGDYFLAYAGKPALTPSGATVAYTEPVPPAAPLPAVIGIYPPAGAPGEQVAVRPAVRFDRVVAGVTASSFLLRRADGSGVAAAVSDNGDGQQFTLRPLAPLEPGMTYTLSLTSAITSVEGGGLTPFAWSFTVAGTPPPAPPSGGLITYTPPRTLTFLSGSHTGYRFDSGGRVIAARTASLSRASGAPTSQRSTLIPGQSGAWFQVTAGIWAGYWVPESAAVYLPGIASQTTFSPLAAVAFGAGSHTGYRFDAAGQITASRLASLSRASGASAGARAIINGQPYLAIANGIWAGYWVPESASVVGP